MKVKAEFYHTFRLPDGTVLEGQWDLTPVLPLVRKIPVKGASILDVACRDGWYAFQFEHMGASFVEAIDFDDRLARRYMERVYHSGVRFHHRNVYSLRTDRPERVDLVFCGDLLCHLENPLLALHGMQRVARKAVYVMTDCMDETRVGSPDYVWWMQERDWRNLFMVAGFDKVTILGEARLTSPAWNRFNGFRERRVVLFELSKGSRQPHPWHCDPDFVIDPAFSERQVVFEDLTHEIDYYPQR